MTALKTPLQILDLANQLPPKPAGTEYAIKFVSPGWTTYGGYQWPAAGRWTPNVPVDEFDPVPGRGGGVHVADSFVAAQSGGASPATCLVVAYRPSEAGEWSNGKLKVRRAKVLGPVDMVGAIRLHGAGADLARAYLSGANLTWANLSGANLTDAYLARANLTGVKLAGANLTWANLARVNLTDADLAGAYLSGAYLARADLDGADLAGANLTGANLARVNLYEAEWDDRTTWPDGYTPPGTAT